MSKLTLIGTDGVKNLKNNVKFLEDLVKERENELNTWKRKCEREEEESFKKEQALIHGYKAEIATLKQQVKHKPLFLIIKQRSPLLNNK